MTENELTVNVRLEIRKRYGYDKLADCNIEMQIPESSLAGIATAIDALVHGMSIEVVANAQETLAMREQEKSE